MVVEKVYYQIFAQTQSHMSYYGQALNALVTRRYDKVVKISNLDPKTWLVI